MFLVRRVGRDEVAAIDAIQPADRRLLEHYPNHRAWLTEALKEVSAGIRLAFGAFRDSLEDPGQEECVGSILLKRGRYSEELELKNLVGSGDVKAEEKRESIRHALLDRVVSFAEARGFSRLEVELPASDTALITTFVKAAFTLVAVRESRFRSTASSYLMQRPLRPSYLGDPYDLAQVAEWILTRVFEAPLTSQADLDLVPAKDPAEKPSVTTLSFGLGANSLLATSALQIPAKAFIFDGAPECSASAAVSVLEEKLGQGENSPAPLAIAFLDRPHKELAESLRQRRIHTFSLEDLAPCLGPAALQKAPTFTSDDIGGLLLDVEPRFRASIRRRRRERFRYHVLNGLGQYVMAASEPYAVLSTPEITDGKVHSIWAIASIQAVEVVSASNLENSAVSEGIWDSDEQFHFYYSERYRQVPDARLVILHCERPTILRKPLAIDTFASAAVQNSIGNDAVFSGPPTCYLDQETVSRLLCLAKENPAFEGSEEEMLESLALGLEVLRGAKELAEFGEDIASLVRRLSDASRRSKEPQLEGPLKSLVDGQVAELGEGVEKFNSIKKDNRFDELTIAQYRKRIAAQLLAILEMLEPVKDQVPGYSNFRQILDISIKST